MMIILTAAALAAARPASAPEAPALEQHGGHARDQGHDMPGMAMPSPNGVPAPAMTGALGPYPARREASGTAWQPDASSHGGVHLMAGDWTLMGPDKKIHVIDGPARMTANSTQMLLGASLAGAGLAYGPSFVFGQHIATGELVRLLPEYTIPDLAIHAIYPTARHVSMKVRQFIDQLVLDFGHQPPWDKMLEANSS